MANSKWTKIENYSGVWSSSGGTYTVPTATKWKDHFGSLDAAIAYMRSVERDGRLKGCACDMCDAARELHAELNSSKKSNISQMPLALVHVMEEITQANTEGWIVKALYVTPHIESALKALPMGAYSYLVHTWNGGEARFDLSIFGIPILVEPFLPEPVVASRHAP